MLIIWRASYARHCFDRHHRLPEKYIQQNSRESHEKQNEAKIHL
jgi:hypothetical protein